MGDYQIREKKSAEPVPEYHWTTFFCGRDAAIPLANERTGYVVSGFLAGGFFLADYYVPGFIAIPILPFLVGGAAGGLAMGFLTEWALMIVSSLVGAIYAIDLFTMSFTLKLLLTGLLFLAGALTQVVMRRMQQK